MNNTIQIQDVTKIYRMGESDVLALKGVSLVVHKGEFVAITGYSGSGKSTLMHIIGCLDKPTSGTYCIDGINIATATRDDLAHIRNKKIGFVFQKFHLLPDLTAQDNVSLPMLYAGKSTTEAHKKASALLASVGLGERTTHYPYQLSGGQQQRVAVARALINTPSIILADEPTGNLDSETSEAIMELFKQLNTQHGATIILVTHEPTIAKKARRIVELIDGRIVSDKLN